MKIYLVCSLLLKELPPALSVISCLKDLGYEVTFISPCLENDYKKFFEFKQIEWKYLYTQKEWMKVKNGNIITRNKIMFYDWNKFVFDVLDKANREEDIVWVLHEETAAKLNTKIFAYNYILSIYELRKDVKLLGRLPSNYNAVAKHAKVLVTPEYNRSHIIASWMDVKDIPCVIPNKPYVTVSNRFDVEAIADRKEILKKRLKDRKMVLYQGGFGPDRKLEPFIEAVREIDDLQIVLMGAENDYLNTLIKKYGDDIIYLPGLAAPMHLEITKLAYIGIVSYQNTADSIYDPLNVVYCAPNKIFEYSQYTVPMICTNQPGLHYTVEAQHAGICVDCDDQEQIRKGILCIRDQYDTFQKGAKILYDSVDIPELVKEVVEITANKK